MRPGYSEGTRRMLNDAQEAAGRYRHRFVHTEHLLLGMLRERGSAIGLLKALGVERDRLRRACERQCQKGDHVMEAPLKLTPRVQQILALAGEQREAMGDTRLDTRHVLLGMLLETEGIAGQVLREAGVTVEAVLGAIETGRQAGGGAETDGLHSASKASSGRKPLWKLFSRA